MSWNDYVNFLFHERKVEGKTVYIKDGCCGGAIVGLDGTVWAQVNMNLSAADLGKLKAAVAQPSTSFSAGGLALGATKYMFVNQLTNDTFAFKKGNQGAAVSICKSCFVVGIHDAKSVVQSCAANVQALGDQLRGAGM